LRSTMDGDLCPLRPFHASRRPAAPRPLHFETTSIASSRGWIDLLLLRYPAVVIVSTDELACSAAQLTTNVAPPHRQTRRHSQHGGHHDDCFQPFLLLLFILITSQVSSGETDE
jgi:hypothetical protein